MATKVTLRQKPISKGRKSIYLDFYPPIKNIKTRKPTRREFLGMYIHAHPKNALDKKHNKETLKIGEGIRQRRENELNKPEIYSEYEREQLRIKELSEQSFITYFKVLARKQKGGSYDNWTSALKHLEKFTNGSLKFGNITLKFLDEFKEFLLSQKLAQNTAAGYFNRIKATLKQAYKDGFTQEDLNAKTEPIKTVETRKCHLSFDELNALVNAECKDQTLKRAALFAALTGLRFSDIKNLKWSDIENIDGNGYRLIFKQQKTQRFEFLPISQQAYELTGGSENPQNIGQDTLVFKGLRYTAYHSRTLKQWVKDAGISRNITFHCFRHTFATLQLFSGTDIYTVSKMLGHRELKTTQVYAQVLDETKRAAAEKINLFALKNDQSVPTLYLSNVTA